MDSNDNEINKDWVVHFINLPPSDQVRFLYRHSLQQSLRKEIEDKVFLTEKEK